MSRILRKRKNVDNGIATNELKPANLSSPNGQNTLKRGRSKKKDVHFSAPEANEKAVPVELPAYSQRNDVKKKGIKDKKIISSSENTKLENKAESTTEINANASNIKKRGKQKNNHAEVNLKETEVNKKDASEDLHLIAEEGEVDIVSNPMKHNEAAFSNNVDSKEEDDKLLKPNKRGRKKKLVEKTAVEDIEIVDLSEPTIEKEVLVKKIPVKRGRKNISTKITENDSATTMNAVKNKIDVSNAPTVNFDETTEDKAKSEISEKHGRKKVKITPKDENCGATAENASGEIKVSDENVPELLHGPCTQENDKKDEISDIVAKVNELCKGNSFDRKMRKRKGIMQFREMDLKKCSVTLKRDEITENIVQELSSKSSKQILDEGEDKNTQAAENGDKGKSSEGNKKREEAASEDDFKPTKPSKVPKKATKSSESKNVAKTPGIEMLDFSNKSINSSGTPWNFKVSSWNINGIRAWLQKDGISYINHEKPDIIAFQETKCSDDKLPDEVKKIDSYYCYWVAGDKDGYSGVGLLSKKKPIEVKYGIGIDLHDNEGRVITAEYEEFFVVAAYVPNAGKGLVRLDYRTQWDKDFLSYLKTLDEKKPVILCGDLNVAHEEIDLANPKTNKKNAGFTKEEREGFSTLLKEGFLDTFRHLNPDVKGAYTFWTYMMNARAKNVGWRLDYFVISERFTDRLCDSIIRKDIYGSDHCPITLFLAL